MSISTRLVTCTCTHRVPCSRSELTSTAIEIGIPCLGRKSFIPACRCCRTKGTAALWMNSLVQFGRKSLLRPKRLSKSFLCSFSAIPQPRFIPSRLEEVEHVEDYQPGGLHPISIGETFAKGRYRVIHKLGFGGSSTIWMARDNLQDSPQGRIVTLKAMRADASFKATDKLPEWFIPSILHATLAPSCYLQTVDDHFVVQGPNGSHRFLVYPFAGPSILSMSDCPGRVSGSRRLRGDLARRVAKQTAAAILHMHRAGVVHGGKS